MEQQPPVSQVQHGEVLNALDRLHERLSAMEERLKVHYEQEHAAFDDTVAWIRAAGMSVKILGFAAAAVAALAAAYEWVKHNFEVMPK